MHQAFAHKRAWGLLFHMEVTQAMVAAMVEAFPEELAEAGLEGHELRTQAAAHLPTLERIGRSVFTRFVERLA